MKKFVFSLETLLNYKLTVEKDQRGELKRAEEALSALYAEQHRLDQAFELNVQSLNQALQQRFDVAAALQRHDAYFQLLREQQRKLAGEIAVAEQRRDQCRALLITTIKEVKAYRKLKEEQYSDYLEAVRQEEAKEMGDLVSYQAITDET